MKVRPINKLLALICVITSHIACARSADQHEESATSKIMYAQLAPDDKYVISAGNLSFFEPQAGDTSQTISDLKPSEDNELVNLSNRADDIADSQLDGDFFLPPFRRRQRSAYFVDPMAPISYNQLKEIVTCPLPRLSLAAETIATNAEWLIFTYCELDILKRGLSGNIIHYPEVPAMRHGAAAYNFMRHSLDKFFRKYLFGNSGLTSEQKLSLFERIFLVTQFRLLTVSEKQAVINSINQHGLHYTSRVYLANWRHSQFYSDHFDFSVDHQPRYVSYQAYGWIRNQAGAKLDGASYQVASPYVGFKLNGVSQEKAYIESEMANCFSGRPDGSFSYNFSVQYYVPQAHESALGGHQHRRHCHSHQSIPHELSISADIGGYHQGFASVADIQKCAKNFVVSLVPATVDVTRPQSWPDINIVRNSNIENLSWRVNTVGGPYGSCVLPRLTNDRVFDGFQWQDFITCSLGVDISTMSPMGKYWPLIIGRSAVDLMYQVKELYLRSDATLVLSEAEIVEKIYLNLTFSLFSQSEKHAVQAAVAQLGLDQAIDIMLSTWYAKVVGNYFNFGKSVDTATIGKNYYKISGIVQDGSGNAISQASVALMVRGGGSETPVLTDASGRYQVSTRKIMNTQEVILQLRVSAAGYASEFVGLPLRALPDTVTTVLTRSNVVTPQQGGRITSPQASVQLRAFPRAVNDVQAFTATDLTETNSPDFPGALAAGFEINPSYQFNNRLQIFIKVSPALKAKIPAGDGLLLMTQVGSQWQLIPSIYHANSNVITASVNHFSRFMLVLSGQTLCYNISDTDISVCVPIAANLDHNPMSSIFDRRTVNSTWEIPGLFAEIKSRLQSGGWKPDDIAVLDDTKTFTDIGMAATCGTTSCPPLADNIPLDFTISPREEVTIGSITGTVATTTNARVSLQAEQCSINPQASLPQLKVNTINNTDIGLTASINLNNMSITYPCARAEHRCKKILFGTYCYDWPVETRCTDTFNGSANANMQGFNQGYARDLNEPMNWRLAGTFSDGTFATDVATPPLIPRPLTLCFDVIGCGTSRINYDIQDEVVSQYKQGVSTQFRAYAMEKITSLTLARLNLLSDPKFDSTNCYGQQLPNSVDGISTGVSHSCAIIDGGAKCWGNGYPGQLGNNSQTSSPYPVQVEGLTSNVTAISVGYAHSCAVVGGAAKCWGHNGAGQLGNNSTVFSTVPVQVEGLTVGVTGIATGNNHSCAIMNGSVKCWGNSGGGQNFGLMPIQIDGWNTGVTAVAARGFYTAAIVNQSVMRLTSSGTVPVPGMGNGATALALGEYAQLCAILSGGAKCTTGFSVLGAADPDGIYQVPGLTANVTSISVGSYHACAVANGAAFCWGLAPGLGAGYYYDEDWVPPRVIPGLEANVSKISAGLATTYSYTCATVGPSIWCWGWDNNPPRLGVGATGYTKTPMPVLNLR